jgi:hypothetical protein
MAYLESLRRLRANVASEVRRIEACSASDDPVGLRAAADRLMRDLDGDIRDVAADVEQLIDREGVGW